MLVAPDPGRPGRRARGDHHIDIVEDRQHPRRQCRLGGAHLFDLTVRDQPAQSGDRPGTRLESLRIRQLLNILVHPAPHPWQHMSVERPRRVIGVTPDHLVAEIPQQVLHPVQCPLLRPADPADHGRRKLGTQRDSQSPRFARCGFDEAPAGSLAGVGHVQEQRGVRNRTSQWAVDAQALPCVIMRSDRHPVSLRFEAEEPTPTRRDADRPRAVGAQRDRCQTGGHGRTATATATAGRVGQIPRIVGGTEGDRLSERPQHHLRHRGLTQDHRARIA